VNKRGRGIKAHIEPDDLTQAACKLMAMHGFFAVSFQMIADEAGISQSTVMHYFKNRSALIQAVLSWVIKSSHTYVSGLIRIEDPALVRLWKHFHGNLAWTRAKPEEVSFLLFLGYLGAVDPEMAALYRQVLSTARQRILEHILAAEREQTIRLRIPPTQAAEILHETLLASLFNLLATQDRARPLRETEQKWRMVIDHILSPRKGMGWAKGFPRPS
jgi:AcrR family transcriptional regulator